MKRKLISIILIFALLASFMLFAGCVPASPTTTPAPTPTTESFKFNYILVQETTKYYLHKIESYKINNGSITFKCSACGNTIHVSEANATMYEKVTLKTTWANYATVCGGDASTWRELLAN